MGNKKIASLVVLGLLIGFVVVRTQQSVGEANDLVAGNQKFLYENCLKTNAAIEDVLPESEQRDCQAEYLERSND